MTRGRRGNPVYMDGVIWFESSVAAARQMLTDFGFEHPTLQQVYVCSGNIGRCANGGAKTAYGHTWTRERI